MSNQNKSKQELIEEIERLGRTNEQLQVKLSQKESNASSQEERERLFDVLDMSGSLAVALDGMGRILRVSYQVLNKIGFLPEEMLGKYYWDIVVTQEYVEAYKTNFYELIKNEWSKSNPREWIGKDGTKRIVSWSLKTYSNASGSIEYILAIGNDVTELQQAQKALSTAESQLESLLAASPVALWSCDTSEEFWPNYLSDNIRQLTGYSPQDYYDDRNLLFNQIHPDDLEHTNGWLAKAFADEYISTELRLKHKDGTWRWFQNEARLERDKKGQPARIVGILRDITAEKEADLTLQELQDQHNTLVETTPHAIMYLDEQLAVIYANPAAHQLLHLSQEEWQLPIGSIDIFATDENGVPLSESARPTVRVMNTGKPIINQLYGLSDPNENSFRWLIVNAYPIFRPDETKPYRVFCELDDITELYETKEELRKSKARLEHVLDNSPMVLYSAEVGDNPHLTFVSNNSEHVSGFTTEEILNTPNLIPSRIHPDDLNAVMASLQRLLEEDNIAMEYRFLHKDGNYRWMREIRRLERDHNGLPVQTIGLVGDFTAVKEAEEALSELQEQHQALVESTSQGITYINADRQMLYANPAALRMYNLTLEELAEPHPGFEHTIVRLDGTEMPLMERPSYIAITTGKQVINVIAGLFDPRDGRTRWLNINAIPVLRPKEDKPYRAFLTFDDITELQRTKANLETSQTRLRQVLSGSPVVTYSLDVSTNERSFISDNIFELSGYTAEEHLNDSHLLLTHIHQDDQKRIFNITDTMEAPQSFTLEYRLIHKDGSVRWIEDMTRFERDDTGKTLDIYGALRDITAQKEAKSTLEQLEIQHHTFIETTSLSIVYLNANREITYLNPAAERLFNLTLAEQVDPNAPAFEYLVTKEDGSPLLHEEKPSVVALRTGLPAMDVIEGWTDPRDNSFKWIRASAVPVFKSGEDKPYMVYSILEDITNIKNAEQALKQSEERHSALVETTSLCICYLDANREYIYANPAAERLFNLTFAEMIDPNAPAFEYIITKEDGSPFPYDKIPSVVALRTGLPVMDVIEGWTDPRDNSFKWIRASAVPVFKSGEDKPYMVYSILEDITNIKNAEQALIQSEERHSALIETTSLSISYLDANRKYIYINPAAERLFNFTIAETIDPNAPAFEYIITKEDGSPFPYDKIPSVVALRTGQPVMDVIEGLTDPRDNSFKWIRASAVPVFKPGEEKPYMIYSIIEDITKVKNAEQALIQSEEQYRTLVNSLPDHVFRIDRDLNYIFTSPGLNTIAGVPDAEFVGKRVGGVLPDGHYTEQWRKTLQQVFETEIEQQVEVSLPEAMGGRSYHFRVLPELVEGKIKTVLAIGRDITDLKKAEEERLDLQLKLADARQQESMGLLAGGMAHDFNNLLAAIAGYTELALIELPEDSPARTYLEQNEIAIQRTADLTKRLLAYAGKSRLTKQSVNLYEAMKEALALQPKLPHDNLHLRGTINDELPEIEADPTQVKQVIMNLVQNSFEALEFNEGSIFIDMNVVQADEAFLQDFIGAPDLAPGRYISIIVGDDGPGIAPEILPKIFEPFFTTKFAGHGLGLSTVLAIMQAHGGGIKVESNPGALTVFTLIFPLNEEAISAKIQPLSGDKKDRDADTILIIDDESSLRSLTSEMLKHIGLKSLEAENCAKGLDLFRLNANQIAVVLLDLTIEKNKAEIIVREVHKLMPEIPIVIMSGYDEQEAEKRFTSHEMAGFLHKPFSIRELKNMLFKSMGRPH